MVLVCQKHLPTDVASPCIHCFREAGSCVSVLHAYFSCTRMIHRLAGSPAFRAAQYLSGGVKGHTRTAYGRRESLGTRLTSPRVQHFSAFHCGSSNNHQSPQCTHKQALSPVYAYVYNCSVGKSFPLVVKVICSHLTVLYKSTQQYRALDYAMQE